LFARRRAGCLRGVLTGSAQLLRGLVDFNRLLRSLVLRFNDLRGENRNGIATRIGRGLVRLVHRLGLDHRHLLVRLLLDEVHVDDVVDDDVVLDDHRPDILRLLKDVRVLVTKLNHDVEARLEEALRWYEYPVRLWRLLVGDIDIDREAVACRRQRRPADMVVAPTPGDPGACPGVPRHPAPADLVLVEPAAIVIDGPRERFVRGKVPAVVLQIDPVAVAIGPPLGIDLGTEDIAVFRMLHPDTMAGERGEEDVDLDRGGGLGGDDANWNWK